MVLVKFGKKGLFSIFWFFLFPCVFLREFFLPGAFLDVSGGSLSGQINLVLHLLSGVEYKFVNNVPLYNFMPGA